MISCTNLTIRVLCIVCIIAGLAGEVAGQHKTLIIAAPGLPSPDGQDVMDYPGNFAISNKGCIFSTRLQNASKRVIYSVSASGTTEVMREGTVISGLGEIKGMIGQLATNDSAETVVYVTIRGEDLVERDALVAGNSISNLRLVALEDNSVPDQNGQFSSFSPSTLNNSGQASFWAAIQNGGGTLSSTNGIFIGNPDGSITQVLRSHQPAPGESNAVNSLSPGTGRMRENGQLLISASVSDIYMGTGYNQRLYRRDTSGALILVAKSHLPAPGTSFVLSYPAAADLNNNGQAVFYAPLMDATFNPRGFGIYKGSNSTALTPIAVTGQTAPDNLGTYQAFNNSLKINSHGHVAFVSLMTGGTASSAVLLSKGTNTQVIAKQGQPASPGNSFSGFGLPRVNDSGTVMFAAQLNGGEFYQGIYLSDGTDTIKVAQVGDVVNGKSIQEIGTDPEAYNSAQQIAYQARFAGDTGYSILLFAPRLKWRSIDNGAWEEAEKWTASLTPAAYNDVDIIPADGVKITGPVSPITLGTLSVGATSTGSTELNLQETGPITSTGGVLIQSRGKLSGNGTIVGNVTNNATLSPGNSPGEILINGNYTQGANGVLEIEIAGGSEGSYDQLIIGGSATLNGALSLNVVEGAHDTLTISAPITITSADAGFAGVMINTVDNQWVPSQDGLGFFLVEFNDNLLQLVDYRNADSDNDGVPDYWMLQHFGQTTSGTDPYLQADYDTDGDGLSNKQEFIAGTDPTDKSSNLRALIQSTLTSDTVTFQTVAGRKYDVEHSLNLTAWTKIHIDIIGDGLEKTVEVGSPDPSIGFYRVIVRR